MDDKRRLLAQAVPMLFNFPPHLQKRTAERPPPRLRTFEGTYETAACCGK